MDLWQTVLKGEVLMGFCIASGVWRVTWYWGVLGIVGFCEKGRVGDLGVELYCKKGLRYVTIFIGDLVMDMGSICFLLQVHKIEALKC